MPAPCRSRRTQCAGNDDHCGPSYDDPNSQLATNPRGGLMYYTIGERFCAQPILRRRPDAILHQCEWKRERLRDYARTPAEAGARNVLTPTRYTGPLCDPIHRELRLRTTTGTLTRPLPIRAAHHHVLGSHHAELQPTPRTTRTAEAPHPIRDCGNPIVTYPTLRTIHGPTGADAPLHDT